MSIKPENYQSFLLENQKDPGFALSQNVNRCKDAAGLTIHDIVAGTGLPINTVKSVLYYENKDYKLTTAVKLAEFFGVSVDELIGSSCIRSETKRAIQQVRAMNNSTREFLYWLVDFMYQTATTMKEKEKKIPVLVPYFHSGVLSFKMNQFTETVDVSEYSDIIRPKLFMGLKIPCRAFLPKFAPGDILLLANDRHPVDGEVVVICTEGHLWFAEHVVETGSGSYKSIFGTHEIKDHDIDQIMGYLVKIHPS